MSNIAKPQIFCPTKITRYTVIEGYVDVQVSHLIGGIWYILMQAVVDPGVWNWGLTPPPPLPPKNLNQFQ